MKLNSLLFLFVVVNLSAACSKKQDNTGPDTPDTPKIGWQKFCMGVDLSYVKQIEDHNGIYQDSSQVRDPFVILEGHGANMVRLRLWHNPSWVRDVYGSSNVPLYSGIDDVEAAIQRAKDAGMAVNLDIHYSDFWADPARQNIPDAWKNITAIEVLCDSVYNYTYKTLVRLNNKGLMPEMVQIGNETNCGMLLAVGNASFPALSVCDGNWVNAGKVFNAGIRAVRDAAALSTIKPLIALHVADPKNLEWWFSNMKSKALVTDFDIIGFSYYPLWHTTVSFNALPALITTLKASYGKQVMVLETAYPWTTQGDDSYGNQFSSQTPLDGFPFTVAGQKAFLTQLSQNVISAGGSGVMYWEPGLISSSIKDSWGTGSSMENCTFFDFDGNLLNSADYMRTGYIFP